MKLKRIIGFFQQLFTYSRRERNGMIILCILLLLLISIKYYIRGISTDSEEDYSEMIALIEQWEKELIKEETKLRLSLFKFNPNEISQEGLDSLAIPGKIKSTILNYREKGGMFYKPSDLKRIYGMTDSLYNTIESYIRIPAIEKVKTTKLPNNRTAPQYFYFDPNKSTEGELVKLGLTKFQIRNLLLYRSKGGSFSKPDDILKIYGLDSLTYENLKPWIRIEMPRKLKINTFSNKVELNSADSLTLVSLKGIGPYFAGTIIKYRKYLGGFYKKEQLSEVYNLPIETYTKIEHNIWVDTTQIQKISINFADEFSLSKHPYISKDMAYKIVRFRNNNGAFSNCNELIKKEVLTVEDYKRILPYLKTN